MMGGVKREWEKILESDPDYPPPDDGWWREQDSEQEEKENKGVRDVV